MLRLLAIALVVCLGTSAQALQFTFNLNMDGAQEFPGPGDPDGTASGSLTLDDATGDISWSFVYADIDAPTAMHIHGPNGGPGSSAGVFVGLGVATSGGAGTLISSTTTSVANVQAILADPGNFYVNIHNGPFSGGAVRGQVPEPTTAALLGLGLLGLALRRRA